MNKRLKLGFLTLAVTAISTVALAQSFTTFVNQRVTTQLDVQGTVTANGDPGTAGQVLTSNGTGDVTWEDASGGGGTPGGADTQIQFNSAGVFGGDDYLSWNASSNQLILGTPTGGSGTLKSSDGTGAAGSTLSLLSGNGASGFKGGDINLWSGTAGANANGANITIAASSSNGTATVGGNISITAGNAVGVGKTPGTALMRGGSGGAGVGGTSTLAGGTSTSGTGGNAIVAGGTASTGTDGSVVLQTNGTNRLEIDGVGTWLLAGDAGTAGYVLTSNGAGAVPTWQVGGGGGGSGTVTSVAAGTGLTASPSPITTTGTMSVDQSFTPTWTGVHTFSPGATPGVAVFNSTAAAGPYATFQRSGSAFGDIGNGGQMGVGFSTDAMAVVARVGNALQFAANGQTSPQFQIDTNGVARFNSPGQARKAAFVANDTVGDNWLGFYEDSALTTRKGYFGYGNAADNTFHVANEESGANTAITTTGGGNILLTASLGTVQANGSDICTENGANCPSNLTKEAFGVILVDPSSCAVSTFYDSYNIPSCSWLGTGFVVVDFGFSATTRPLCTVSPFINPSQAATAIIFAGSGPDDIQVKIYNSADALADIDFTIHCRGV